MLQATREMFLKLAIHYYFIITPCCSNRSKYVYTTYFLLWKNVITKDKNMIVLFTVKSIYVFVKSSMSRNRSNHRIANNIFLLRRHIQSMFWICWIDLDPAQKNAEVENYHMFALFISFLHKTGHIRGSKMPIFFSFDKAQYTRFLLLPGQIWKKYYVNERLKL